MWSKLMQSVKNLGIPNLLSFLRLVMIPVFVVLYLLGFGIIAAVVLILSGITDVLDGFIARRFNMVTELGRILDPLADKLTQATVCICLVVENKAMIWILFLLILKEFVMIGAGANMIRKGKEMLSSKWFGKMGTVVFYTVMIVIVAFNPSDKLASILLGVVLGFMIFSLIMYAPFFFQIIAKKQ
jgi:Phosphatidylglycerophosphate synthase